MKFSQFNSIVPSENQYVLYNSFQQKVILLVPELYDLLISSINSIDKINEYHPVFYQYLVHHKFIVENSADEVKEVITLRNNIDENEKEFILFINPTLNCNFKCWYCYETHIKHSKLDDLIIERIKKFILNIFKNNSVLEIFSLSFFGGEPLLYFKKNVIPIIDYFFVQCKNHRVQPSINFTTNGFLINRGFIDYFKKHDYKPSLQITLDGYKDEHDAVRNTNGISGTYNKIIKNIRLLIENRFFVRVRINYTDKNIHNAVKIINDFLNISQKIKDNYLVFDFQRVWQNKCGSNVDEVLNNTISNFRKRCFNVDFEHSFNNLTDSCYADKRNSVVVNYNGYIYKCTARDFNKKNREGYLDENGYLIWEKNSLEKRMNAKFKNNRCFSCKIFPLCIGGCSQQAIENKGVDYCIYDESEKDNIIKDKIEKILYNSKDIKIPTLIKKKK
jgi:uncharacterized protein